MKSRRRPLFTAAAVLLAAGVLRMPLEQAMTVEFREQGLLSQPLELELKEKLGQNSSAIALAGLRTLVATFTQLKVTEHFSRQDWPDLERAMNTTVQLAPRGTYYWDMGAWHIGTNASTYYRAEAGLPELRARAEARRWVAKGREFYRRGIRNNPDDWQLRAALGNLCSDVFRFPDDTLAVEAYTGAIATGDAPPELRRALLRAEVRVGKNPEKSLAEVRELLEVPTNRVPTLLCIRYVLEQKIHPSDDPVGRAVEIFGSREKALRNLGSYFLNIYDRLPMEGVETVVRMLEYHKGICPEDPKSFIYERDALPARSTRYR
jgi:hypothetical protein